MLRKLVFAFAVCATCASAGDVEIVTYAGPATAPAVPDKFVVLDVAALDTLDALEVVPDGTISPVYLPYLEHIAENSQIVGTLFDPDFEALNALQPDLIIAGGRSSGHVAALSGLGKTIDMTIWENPVSQGLARLTAYGQIFNQQARAAELKDAFHRKLDEARELGARQGGALIVMTNGPKVTAYGAGGRFGWLYTELGLSEAVETVAQSTHGEAISFEFIRAADPDVLLVIDRLAAIGRGGETAQSTLDNALVRDTKAWKSGKVVYLSAAPIYIAGGGIQAMTITLDELIEAFAANTQ